MMKESKNKFLVFPTIFQFFPLLPFFGLNCFETFASLKERQLLTEHINYGQKNEIGEKSREIGTTTASRA